MTNIARLLLALASLLTLGACASPGAHGPTAHHLTITAGKQDRYYDPSSEEWKFED